jgi:nucleoside-diphosphate kinase
VHKERPFFGELVEFMRSGPVVVQVLEGENAVARNREIMGATDPKKAAPGTIRAEYALSIGENSVHGSDAPETARQEIAFFFAESDIVG